MKLLAFISVESADFLRVRSVKLLVVSLLLAFFNWVAFTQAEKALPGEVGNESSHGADLRKMPLGEFKKLIQSIQADPGDNAAKFNAEIKSKAESGSALYQYRLGLDYLKNGKSDEAATWFLRAADQGLEVAQRKLGILYATGEGVPRDDEKAVKWFRLAAEQGDAVAQARLGFMFSFGSGVPRDKTEALKWYRQAAEQGDSDGQLGVGLAYGDGQGVLKNEAEAAKWYRKAAEQGNAAAQLFLGNNYSHGVGVERNLTEAAKWFQKSAEQGVTLAQALLGLLYINGEGVPQDFAEGRKWAMRAAEQGDGRGQGLAALIYVKGLGVPQDYVEGYKWLNLAAADGEPGALRLRGSLLTMMTPDQIAEGQRRASAFVPNTENSRRVIREAQDLQPLPSHPKSSGSGFFITANGYLLTSSHVVEGANSITVKTKQRDFAAKLVRTDAVNDVALLKVSGSFHPLSIVASHTVKLGDSVLTIGFPNTTLQGVEPKLTRGEINSLAGLKDDPRHFQISVAVQPGNSGGPLVDTSGNVVGIVTARLSEAAALRETGALPQVVNYALKSSFITAFLESTPEVMSKLAKPDTIKSRRSEDVVKEVQEAAALVLVY